MYLIQQGFFGNSTTQRVNISRPYVCVFEPNVCQSLLFSRSKVRMDALNSELREFFWSIYPHTVLLGRTKNKSGSNFRRPRNYIHNFWYMNEFSNDAKHQNRHAAYWVTRRQFYLISRSRRGPTSWVVSFVMHMFVLTRFRAKLSSFTICEYKRFGGWTEPLK